MHTSDSDAASEFTGFRTRLQPGMLETYRRTHARLPEPIERALRDAGVRSWNIWSDDLVLFHTIETAHGREAMSAAMSALGPIDPEWDALIDTMVDRSPGSSRDLDFIWGMNLQGQGSTRPRF